MSIVGEFHVATETFALGRALRVEGTRIEFDRVVPTGGDAASLWVWTDDVDGFVTRLRERSSIDEVTVHDRIDGGALCDVDWDVGEPNVLTGIAAGDLTLLEATGDAERWSFRVRAADWGAVTAFREFCEANDVRLQLGQLSQLTGPGESVGSNLTSVQRETLVEAFRSGYYDAPRRVSLTDLAEKFGVSPRAVSQRLQRGVANLIESTLHAQR